MNRGLQSSSSRKPPALAQGRYVVCRPLGRGGTARVYLAFDTRLKLWRAIKVLSYKYVDDEHVFARFQQEAQTMARLQHRHLVRVFDINEEGFTPFIVMEYCEGGAITGWMKRNGKMPPHLACKIIAEVCAGLQVAHDDEIIHRDIKPQNILVDKNGVCKLTDFGIAQVHEDDDDKHLTQAGSTMGTFAFMAPEQRNDALTVDVRADIYALGATLYTLMTLKTSTELFLAERGDKMLKGIPEPVIKVLLTCVQYERDDRYANVAELISALEEAMAQLGPQNYKPINEVVDTPPKRPPAELPEDLKFDELNKALALDEKNPTYVPSANDPELHPSHPSFPRGMGNYDSNVDSKVIPYFMPETSPSNPGLKDDRFKTDVDVDDPLPEYYAAEEVEKIERLRTETAAKGERVEGPKKKVEVEPPQPFNWGPVIMAAVGAIAVLTVMMIAIAMGASSVNSAAKVASTKEKMLFQAVENEQEIIAQFQSMGAPVDSLYSALDTFNKVPDEDPAKHKNAQKFVKTADVLMQSHGLSVGPELVAIKADADGRLARLNSANEEFSTAWTEWESAAGGVFGGLACTLGVASSPE